MDALLQTLNAEGLRRFRSLENDAVSSVTERLYSNFGSVDAEFGAEFHGHGRDACREELAFHLEFLRPALEFGLLAPMVDYLRWLKSVLAARSRSDEHLTLSLDWLSEFFVAHMAAAEGAVVAAALAAVRTQFLAAEAPLAPTAPPEPGAETAFQTALLAGDQNEASAVVNRCMDTGRSLVDVELHIIQPAMYRIGEKWQANEVSVAQEHIATAIVQSIMTAALMRSTPPAPISKRALLACVAGNRHTVGLRMVADSFQLAGWDVQFLGADVPTASLIEQIGVWTPELVGLSLSFAQHLPVVKEIIARLDARFGPARPFVIIGGLAVNRFDRLSDVVGADASSADARAAVGAAKILVNA